MRSRATVEESLAQTHVAFVGVSRDPERSANTVYHKLREGGRSLYPVNRSEGTPIVEGDPAYSSLSDVAHRRFAA